MTSLRTTVSNSCMRHMLTDTAWWIAFGPHGPRAEDPPGEWSRILLYSAVGVGVSAVIFFTIHSFAKPPPRTMTKEWQEATNEYLRVCDLIHFELQTLTNYRPRTLTPSTVSRVKATVAKAMYRANRPKHKVSVWRRKNRRWLGEGCMCFALAGGLSRIL
jgi:hypothetical protein